MVRRALHALFVEHLGLKALAMVLSLGLFVFVRAGRSVENTLGVDVVYQLPPDRVLMTPLVEHLSVTVRGGWARLSNLKSWDFKSPVRIDLGREPSGEYHFRPEILSLPPGVQLISISPPSMRIEFEPRMERLVPVEVIVEGTLPPGWTLERAEASPLAIRVRGPANVVNELKSAPTLPVLLGGHEASFVQQVELAPLPRLVELGETRSVQAQVTLVKGTPPD